MNERPTPETDALILSKDGFGATDYEWRVHSRRLERERDEEREQNAYLRCIAERAIHYLDQSYRDGFSNKASELRYKLKQLKEGGK